MATRPRKLQPSSPRIDLLGNPFDPGFCPDFTPKEMLRSGIFGGTYFARRPQDWNELPAEWREGITQLIPFEQYDAKLNYFKVRSGQTYEQWLANDWIRGCDPLGWFQWYCRYTLGRRCNDDPRQIGRWRSYRRHIGMIHYLCNKTGHSIHDPAYARAARQGLLHWAYDPLCYNQHEKD